MKNFIFMVPGNLVYDEIRPFAQKMVFSPLCVFSAKL